MAVAPIDAVERVVRYAVSRIEPGKLLLGFPNYAYDWTLPYEAGLTRAVVIGNEAARQLAFDTRSEIQFDETAQTPWFSYTGMDGAVHQVWFEDAALESCQVPSGETIRAAGARVLELHAPVHGELFARECRAAAAGLDRRIDKFRKSAILFLDYE